MHSFSSPEEVQRHPTDRAIVEAQNESNGVATLKATKPGSGPSSCFCKPSFTLSVTPTASCKEVEASSSISCPSSLLSSEASFIEVYSAHHQCKFKLVFKNKLSLHRCRLVDIKRYLAKATGLPVPQQCLVDMRALKVIRSDEQLVSSIRSGSSFRLIALSQIPSENTVEEISRMITSKNTVDNDRDITSCGSHRSNSNSSSSSTIPLPSEQCEELTTPVPPPLARPGECITLDREFDGPPWHSNHPSGRNMDAKGKTTCPGNGKTVLAFPMPFSSDETDADLLASPKCSFEVKDCKASSPLSLPLHSKKKTVKFPASQDKRPDEANFSTGCSTPPLRSTFLSKEFQKKEDNVENDIRKGGENKTRLLSQGNDSCGPSSWGISDGKEQVNIHEEWRDSDGRTPKLYLQALEEEKKELQARIVALERRCVQAEYEATNATSDWKLENEISRLQQVLQDSKEDHASYIKDIEARWSFKENELIRELDRANEERRQWQESTHAIQEAHAKQRTVLEVALSLQEKDMQQKDFEIQHLRGELAVLQSRFSPEEEDYSSYEETGEQRGLQISSDNKARFHNRKKANFFSTFREHTQTNEGGFPEGRISFSRTPTHREEVCFDRLVDNALVAIGEELRMVDPITLSEHFSAVLDVDVKSLYLDGGKGLHEEQFLHSPPLCNESSSITLLLTVDPEAERLFLYSTLLNYLPSRMSDQHRLYERLLQGSLLGREVAGGTVGISKENQLVLLSISLDLRRSDPKAIVESLPSFVNAVRRWTHFLRQEFPSNLCTKE